MGEKPIAVIDGSKEEREQIMKAFFGLSAEQSFQDLPEHKDIEED